MRTGTCFSPSRCTMFDAGAHLHTHNTVSAWYTNAMDSQVLKANFRAQGY